MTVIIQQGGPSVTIDTTTPVKSRIVAGILGIFLGWLGVHRFYMESRGIGTVQLLLTILTCGWGAIVTIPWGILEGVLILTGAMSRDGLGRPLKA